MVTPKNYPQILRPARAALLDAAVAAQL